MRKVKLLNDIMNWLIQGGGVIYVVAFLYTAVKPLIKSKKEHAQTVQAKEAWSFAEQVAQAAVNSLVSSQKDGQAKFDEATKILQHVLGANGLQINDKSAQTLVQAAYEKSPLTGNTKEVPDK